MNSTLGSVVPLAMFNYHVSTEQPKIPQAPPIGRCWHLHRVRPQSTPRCSPCWETSSEDRVWGWNRDRRGTFVCSLSSTQPGWRLTSVETQDVSKVKRRVSSHFHFILPIFLSSNSGVAYNRLIMVILIPTREVPRRFSPTTITSRSLRCNLALELFVDTNLRVFFNCDHNKSQLNRIVDFIFPQ